MLNTVPEIELKQKMNYQLASRQIDKTSGDIADSVADIQSLKLTDGDAVNEEEQNITIHYILLFSQ